MRLFGTLTRDQFASLMGGEVIEDTDTDAIIAGLGGDIELDRGGDMITVRLPNERPGIPTMNLIVRADNMDGHGALTLVIETLDDIEPEKPEEAPSEATLELIGRLRRALIGHLPAHHELLADADALLKPKPQPTESEWQPGPQRIPSKKADGPAPTPPPKALYARLNEANIIPAVVGRTINLCHGAVVVHYNDFSIREGYVTSHPEGSERGGYVPTVYGICNGVGESAYYDEGAGEWRKA